MSERDRFSLGQILNIFRRRRNRDEQRRSWAQHSLENRRWLGLEGLEPRLMLSTWVVDGGGGADFTTISAALADAGVVGGDVIQVNAGTYTEDLVVDKDVTLQSTSGAALTTIQLVDGVGIDIQAGGAGATIGGSAGHGFTIDGDDAATTFPIQLTNGPAGVTISYNTVNMTGSASQGVSVGAAGATGLTLSHNAFTTDAGDGALWGPSLVDLTATNNVIGGTGSYGFQTEGLTGTSVFQGNTITGLSGAGGVVLLSGNGGTAGVSIVENTITGISNAVRLYDNGAGSLGAIDITANDLSGNTVGVKIDNDQGNFTPAGWLIQNNDLSGATTAGISFDNAVSGGTLDATENYWGDAAGPDVATNPATTTGSAITGAGANDVTIFQWYDDVPPALGGTGQLTGPVQNTDTGEFFLSIQNAIDDADTDNGDTIEVSDGTYTEDLTINKELTILSENGSGATTLQLVDGVGIDIQANNVSLGGSTEADDLGFTITPHATDTTFAIQINGVDNISIQDSSISTIGDASQGISIGSAGVDTLSIADNTFLFDDTGGDVAIDFNPGSTAVVSTGIDIEENIFDDSAAGAGARRSMKFGNVNTVSIDGNTIDGSFSFWIGDTNPSDQVEIFDNTINSGSLMFIRDGAGADQPLTNLSITQNVFDNNSTTNGGILFYADSGDAAGSLLAENLTDTILINNNSFANYAGGNALRAGFGGNPAGYLNGVTIDATNNYWGSDFGPTHADNTYNVVDQEAVVGNLAGATIDYVDWWTGVSGTPGSLSGTTFAPIENVDTSEHFSSFQTAIDATATVNGNTIEATDGTYTEDFAIDKNLTIRSENGSASTTINLVDGVGIDIQNPAADVTLGGGATDGFEIVGSAATTFMVQNTNGNTGTTISNNSFTTGAASQHAISGGIAGSPELTVTDNTFNINHDNSFGLYAPYVTDLTFTGNALTATSTTGTNGIQIPGLTSTTASLIDNNTFDGFSRAIGLFTGEDVSDVTISNNTIQGGTIGMDFGSYDPDAGGDEGDITTVTITDNTIQNNDTGIQVDDNAHVLSSNFVVQDNVITGNTTAGLDFDNTNDTIDVSQNYWGTVNGPALAGRNTFNVGTQGNAITEATAGSVTFVRWYDADPATGALFAPVQNTDTGEYFASLQAAIDDTDTDNGDTIVAQDGTFTETIDIDKELTLTSANGPITSTTITSDAASPIVTVSADNVTLGGGALDISGAPTTAPTTGTSTGFHILGGAGTTFAVQLTGHRTGVSVLGNRISTVGNASQGVSMTQTTDVDITGNWFEVDDTNGDAAITWNPGSSEAVSANSTVNANFVDVTAGTASNAVKLGNFTTMNITENVFESVINVYIPETAVTCTGLDISYNVFPDMPTGTLNDTSVSFVSDPAQATRLGVIDDMTFTQNTLDGRDRGVFFYGDTIANTGIEADDVTWANVLVNENSFVNTPKAVGFYGAMLDNTAIPGFDAMTNWWGAAGGPGIDSGVGLDNGATAVVDTNPFWDSITGSGTVADPYVGTATYPINNIDTGEGFLTIQAAINDADTVAGNTITVGAGPWTENLTIDKGVNLLGDITTPANATLLGTHTISASGASLRGFALGDGDGATGNVIVRIDSTGIGGLDNITIRNNTFDLDHTGGADGDVGVGLGDLANSNALNNIVVTNNVFTNPTDQLSNPLRVGAKDVDPTYDVAVENLSFSYNDVSGGTCQIYLANENLDNLTYSWNDFDNTDGVLFIRGVTGGGGTGVLSDFTFSNNEITNSAYGLGIDVAGNQFTDANFAGDLRVRNNSFNVTGAYGFGAATVQSAGVTTTVFEAYGNWWNSANGPTQTANTFNVGTQGEAASDHFEAAPWRETGADGQAAATPGFSPTGPLFAPVETGGTYYVSIQDAVDAAAAGDTIYLAAGTFDESIAINGTAGLTVMGQGSGTTTVDASGDQDFVFTLQDADNTTLQDMTLDSESPAGTLAGGVRIIESDGVTLDGLEIFATALTADTPSVHGISVAGRDDAGSTYNYGPSNDLTVIDTTVTVDGTDSAGTALWADPNATGPYTGWLIGGSNDDYNTFNSTGPVMQIYDVSASEVRYNEFNFSSPTTSDNSNALWGTWDQSIQDLVFTNNYVKKTYDSDAAATVMQFSDEATGSGGTITNVTLTQNIFDKWGIGTGLYFGDTVAADTVSATYNRFITTDYDAGTALALDGGATGTVDATYNWWGAASGPDHANNPNAAPGGGTITGSVDFMPWLATQATNSTNQNVTVKDDTNTLYAVSTDIQGGIDAVAPIVGHKVIVDEGTYAGAVINGKDDIQLLGQGDTTIIDVSDGIGIVVEDSAGVTVQNFRIDVDAGAGQFGAGVRLRNADTAWLDLLTINATGLDSPNPTVHGVSVAGDENLDAAGTFGPSDNLEVTRSTVTVDGGNLAGTALYAENNTTAANTGWVIGGAAGNTNTFESSGTVMELYDVTNSQVTHNTFLLTSPSTSQTGNVIWNSDQQALDLLDFESNIVDGAYDSDAATHVVEIHDEANAAITNVNVQYNILRNWGTGSGLSFSDDVDGSTVTVWGNSFSTGTGVALNNATGETLDASGNWWGINTPAGVAAESNGTTDYSPWLDTGTDTAAAIGFQGDFSTLHVDDDSPQTGGDTAIQEGINDVTASTVIVHAGAYTEDVTLDKSVTLLGAQSGNPVGGRTMGGAGESTVTGEWTLHDVSDVTLNGFTLSDAGAAVETLFTIDTPAAAVDNANLLNNFFDFGSGDTAILIGDTAAGRTLGVTNVTIQGNSFANADTDTTAPALKIGDMNNGFDVPVDGLDFVGNTTDYGHVEMLLKDRNLANLNFDANTFTNTAGAVLVNGVDDTPGTGVLSGFEFSNNDVDATNGFGVGFDQFGDSLADANFAAGTDGHVDVTIGGNNFGIIPAGGEGFGAVGILTAGFTGTLDAEMNWWGAADGPSGAGTGTGAFITDHVDYAPFVGGLIDVDLEGTWQTLPGPTTFIPGDSHAVSLQVENTGTSLAQGWVAVDMYYSNQQTLGADATLFQTYNTYVSLAANSSYTLGATFTVPELLPAAASYFIAVIDGSDVGETDPSNNTTVSADQGALAWQFGNVAGLGNRSLTLTHEVAGGTDVPTTFRLTGGGTGTVTGYDSALGFSVDITGAGTASVLNVSSTGRTLVHDIDTDSNFGTMNLLNADVTGSVDINGGAGTLNTFNAWALSGGLGETFESQSVSRMFVYDDFTATATLAGADNATNTVNSWYVTDDFTGAMNVTQGGVKLWYTGGDATGDLTLGDAGGMTYGLRTAIVKGDAEGTWNIGTGGDQASLGEVYWYGNSAVDLTVAGPGTDDTWGALYLYTAGNRTGNATFTTGGVQHLLTVGNATGDVTLVDADSMTWGLINATTFGDVTGVWDVTGSVSSWYAGGDQSGALTVAGRNNATTGLGVAIFKSDHTGNLTVEQGSLNTYIVYGDSTGGVDLDDAGNVTYGLGTAKIYGDLASPWNIGDNGGGTDARMNYLYVGGNNSADIRVTGSGANDVYGVNTFYNVGNMTGSLIVDTGGVKLYYVNGNSTGDVTIDDALGLTYGIGTLYFGGNVSGTWDIDGALAKLQVTNGTSSANFAIQGTANDSYGLISAYFARGFTGDLAIQNGGLSTLTSLGDSTGDVTLGETGGMAGYALNKAYIRGNLSGTWTLGNVGVACPVGTIFVTGNNNASLTVTGAAANTDRGLNYFYVGGDNNGDVIVQTGSLGTFYTLGDSTGDLTLADPSGAAFWGLNYAYIGSDLSGNWAIGQDGAGTAGTVGTLFVRGAATGTVNIAGSAANTGIGANVLYTGGNMTGNMTVSQGRLTRYTVMGDSTGILTVADPGVQYYGLIKAFVNGNLAGEVHVGDGGGQGTVGTLYVGNDCTADVNIAGWSNSTYAANFVYVGGNNTGSLSVDKGGVNVYKVIGNSIADVTLSNAIGGNWWAFKTAQVYGDLAGTWTLTGGGNLLGLYGYGNTTADITVSGYANKMFFNRNGFAGNLTIQGQTANGISLQSFFAGQVGTDSVWNLNGGLFNMNIADWTVNAADAGTFSAGWIYVLKVPAGAGLDANFFENNAGTGKVAGVTLTGTSPASGDSLTVGVVDGNTSPADWTKAGDVIVNGTTYNP